MRHRPARAAARPAAPSVLTPVAPPVVEAALRTKVMLVDYQDGQALDAHPELAPLVQEGWRVKSAVPRLLEVEGPKLLVILTTPSAEVPPPPAVLPEQPVSPSS